MGESFSQEKSGGSAQGRFVDRRRIFPKGIPNVGGDIEVHLLHGHSPPRIDDRRPTGALALWRVQLCHLIDSKQLCQELTRVGDDNIELAIDPK